MQMRQNKANEGTFLQLVIIVAIGGAIGGPLPHSAQTLKQNCRVYYSFLSLSNPERAFIVDPLCHTISDAITFSITSLQPRDTLSEDIKRGGLTEVLK